MTPTPRMYCRAMKWDDRLAQVAEDLWQFVGQVAAGIIAAAFLLLALAAWSTVLTRWYP